MPSHPVRAAVRGVHPRARGSVVVNRAPQCRAVRAPGVLPCACGRWRAGVRAQRVLGDADAPCVPSGQRGLLGHHADQGTAARFACTTVADAVGVRAFYTPVPPAPCQRVALLPQPRWRPGSLCVCCCVPPTRTGTSPTRRRHCPCGQWTCTYRCSCRHVVAAVVVFVVTLTVTTRATARRLLRAVLCQEATATPLTCDVAPWYRR